MFCSIAENVAQFKVNSEHLSFLDSFHAFFMTYVFFGFMNFIHDFISFMTSRILFMITCLFIFLLYPPNFSRIVMNLYDFNTKIVADKFADSRFRCKYFENKGFFVRRKAKLVFLYVSFFSE